MSDILPARPVHKPGDASYRVMDAGERTHTEPRWSTGADIIEKYGKELERRVKESILEDLKRIPARRG